MIYFFFDETKSVKICCENEYAFNRYVCVQHKLCMYYKTVSCPASSAISEPHLVVM